MEGYRTAKIYAITVFGRPLLSLSSTIQYFCDRNRTISLAISRIYASHYSKGKFEVNWNSKPGEDLSTDFIPRYGMCSKMTSFVEQFFSL